MKAPDDWNDHVRLLDFGIKSFETRDVKYPSALPDLKIVGSDNKLKIKAETKKLSMLPNDFDKIAYEVCVSDVVFAPIKSGDIVGCVKVIVNNKEVARLPCVATDSVVTNKNKIDRDFGYWIRRMLFA